eukprot:TRINITY_DN7187_c0_g1_i2.p2 TRINITY_DN7187_c0_g1~~TRINITY_DN7187_c0_g1_i2.p2  ORF type:complete len:148 (-),score=37.82 TRINITY_DN7187_c0_g1_i2:975-1418(-)
MERRSLKDEQGSLMPFWLDDESSEEEPRFKVERQPPRTLSRDAVDLVMNAIPNSTVVGKKKRTPMSEIAIRQVHDFRNRVKVALEEEPVSKKTRVIMSVEKTIERNVDTSLFAKEKISLKISLFVSLYISSNYICFDARVFVSHSNT